MLWETDRLVVRTIRSGDGQTAEVADASGTALATVSDGGDVVGADGVPLAAVPLLTTKRKAERRRSHPAELYLAVNDPRGARVGTVAVRKYTFSPLGKKLEADVAVGDTNVARLEPADRKGEEVTIAAGDVVLARLTQTDHDRGLRRSVTTWDLELAPDAGDAAQRMVLVCGLLRYAKVRARIGELVAD